MSRKLILGLDIGTSSVRGALYDEHGAMIPRTLVKNERTLTATDDGGAEIDAELAFRQVVETIDGVLARSAKVKGEIEYVASCAFWHSLVGVDSKGKPTTKVFGWADTRSREYTAVLQKKFDEAEVHNRTGARFHSSFWPAKLLWLRKEYSDVFGRTERWLSLSDLIALKLTAKSKTSVSMASATGIFDQRNCEWDTQLLRHLKIRLSQLPGLAAEGVPDSGLTPAFKKRWPQLGAAGWFPSVGDGAANNIGSGCTSKEKAALMIGTSGAARIAYRGDLPGKVPPGLWCYRVDRDRIIIGGALSDGGGLYKWLKDKLDLTNDAEIERQISRREPNAHGLALMPFFAGERSTGYNENARGALVGVRSSTDAIDLIHAALESVSYRFAEIFDQLSITCGVEEIIASGGALRESAVWPQIIADVLGRDLTLPDTHEASMRGAVLLALETTGRIEKIESIPTQPGKQFRADKTRKSVYATARKRHQEVYKLLIDREIS